MATSATATHRNESSNNKLPSSAPLSSPPRSATPRHPTVSPLSTTARSSTKEGRETQNDSDQLAKQLTDDANHMDSPEDSRDDGSSSLSEPDDDREDDEMQDMTASRNGRHVPTLAQQNTDVDSEAETERLDQTPVKARNHATALEKTPSKLGQTSAVDDELSDPPSPLPVGPGAASSTSTTGTAAGQKRKRSDSVDSSLTSAQSDLGESPPKHAYRYTVEDDPADDDDESRSSKSRKVKSRGRSNNGTERESGSEGPESGVSPAEEQNEEDTAKAAEEMKYKDAAAASYDALAKQFTAFREKLSAQRIEAVTAELDLLSSPASQHPGYLQQVACLNSRLTKQAHEIESWYRHKLVALRRTTLAQRSQLFSQHFQSVRDQREDVLYRLGEDWYNIQKERRKSSQTDDQAYVFKFPSKRSEQIRQQAKYNHEVSVLSGVAKYVGFPAAPEIKGADADLVEDDLKAMQITKRIQHQPTTHTVYLSQVGVFNPRQLDRQNERLAHEQFMEQTPWARPQGPIPTHGTPNLTHTPDWAADPNKHAIRQFSSAIHNASSPFATPIPQRHLPAEDTPNPTTTHDPVDQPSTNTPNPAIPDSLSQPLLHNPKTRTNGAVISTDTPNFRNFSNISGTSTIDAPLESSSSTTATPHDNHNHQSSQPAQIPKSTFASNPQAGSTAISSLVGGAVHSPSPAARATGLGHGSLMEEAGGARKLGGVVAGFRPGGN